jgi:hypothetical protein
MSHQSQKPLQQPKHQIRNERGFVKPDFGERPGSNLKPEKQLGYIARTNQ